ncbi:hypothetical protein MXB_2969 [Myxobolus squamalis]|nr:hypothetical protein MXB_2969 [Myxobolus squamalis]
MLECNQCTQQSSERVPLKQLNKFLFGIHFNDTCVVFSKKKSVDHLFNIINQCDNKNDMLKSYPSLKFSENYLNLISQGCSNKIAEIKFNLKELCFHSFSMEKFDHLKSLIQAYIAYLYVNVNHVLLGY